MEVKFPLLTLLFVLALTIEGASVFIPEIWLVVTALLGVSVVALVIMTWPQQSLMGSFFLLLLASTKFRTRNPTALLAGSTDAQVIYELALYGLVLFIVVFNIASRPLRNFRPTLWEGALLLYSVLALLSATWSYDVRLSVVRGAQLCILCAASYTAVSVFGPQRVLRVLTTSVVLYVLFFASLTLFLSPSYPLPPYFAQTRYLRFSWFHVHPITAATCTASAAILVQAEGLFAVGGWRRRIIGIPLWLCMSLLIVILLATRSRGPLFAFIAAGGGLWMSKHINPWLGGVAGSLAAFIFAGVVGSAFSTSQLLNVVLVDDNPLAIYLLRDQNPDDFLSMTGRVGLWQSAYEQFLQRPLLGYGYMSSRNFLLDVRAWAGDAHNALVESLLNLGLIGAILLWCTLLRSLFFSTFATLFAVRRPSWPLAAVFGSLAFTLGNSLTNSTFAGPAGYDALLFFFALYLCEKLRREQTEEDKIVVPVVRILRQEGAAV